MKNIVLLFIILFSLECRSQEVTITMWKDSVIGALWNSQTSTVVYNRKDANGNFKIYLSDSLGNNEVPLRYAGWPDDRQQWAEEWHPSGKYIFCYVEKAEYAKEKGHKRAPIDATPGYGAYTDLWLISRDGKQAWQLTNLPNQYSSGIIHSAISPDGSMFAWSERVAAPKFTNKNLAAGAYVFKVADFSLDSIPHFSNIRSFQPGGVLACNELESISADKSTITFYSTFETKNLFATPIYTMNILNGKIQRLTYDSFAQAPSITPDGKKIVYMTGYQCDIFPFQLQGADWWIMNIDGSKNIRLTYMNKKNHPQSVNKFRLAGSLSFMSNNSFLGGIMTKSLGLTGYTVKVSFKE